MEREVNLLFNYLLSESRLPDCRSGGDLRGLKDYTDNIITNQKMEISEIHKSVAIRDSDNL